MPPLTLDPQVAAKICRGRWTATAEQRGASRTGWSPTTCGHRLRRNGTISWQNGRPANTSPRLNSSGAWRRWSTFSTT
eukprot:11205538-Lingulodinium_polyedra.AAC.1